MISLEFLCPKRLGHHTQIYCIERCTCIECQVLIVVRFVSAVGVQRAFDVVSVGTVPFLQIQHDARFAWILEPK